MINYRQVARESAIERWNAGPASEWDEGIESLMEVQAALEFQAVANGWDVDPDQLEADAEVITDWLESERNR